MDVQNSVLAPTTLNVADAYTTAALLRRPPVALSHASPIPPHPTPADEVFQYTSKLFDTTEGAYPYTATTGACKAATAVQGSLKVFPQPGYVTIASSKAAIAAAVSSTGPVVSSTGETNLNKVPPVDAWKGVPTCAPAAVRAGPWLDCTPTLPPLPPLSK